jgi:hypothetical protein
MHRHESNCKYDITMFFDDDMLAGILKHHKFTIHLPQSSTSLSFVDREKSLGKWKNEKLYKLKLFVRVD